MIQKVNYHLHYSSVYIFMKTEKYTCYSVKETNISITHQHMISFIAW